MRQSSTFTQLEQGKLIRHKHPLMRGRALIEARTLLGPATHIQRLDTCVILSSVGGERVGMGLSWEDALRDADPANRPE